MTPLLRSTGSFPFPRIPQFSGVIAVVLIATWWAGAEDARPPKLPPLPPTESVEPAEPGSVPKREILTAVPVEELPGGGVKVAEIAEPELGIADVARSKSLQFAVSGGPRDLRNSVAIRAEEAKTDLLALIDGTDSWKVPVRIYLRGEVNGPVPVRSTSLRLVTTEGSYGVEINVSIARGIAQDRFMAAATAAMVYEMGLRKAGDQPEDKRFLVPPWLVFGLREAIDWRAGRSDRRLYEALFENGGLFNVDEMLGLSEAGFDQLDGGMRAAYRVSAGALVLALLEQPDGTEAFRAFLDDVAGYEGEMSLLLREHFSGLMLSANSLEKWWALQLATKGAAVLTDVMSVEETDAALSEILQFRILGADGVTVSHPIREWMALGDLPTEGRSEVARPVQAGLVRLSYRCFPSYRAVIQRYQTVVNDLVLARIEEVPKELDELAEFRNNMGMKAQRATDYLNWFEITRARETSGEFDDYLRLKDQLKSVKTDRTDSVSRYLDLLDVAFDRGEPLPRRFSEFDSYQIPVDDLPPDLQDFGVADQVLLPSD